MKTLLSILCILAFCISAQAQYGRCFSQFNAYDEFLWTYSATQYGTTAEAQAIWLEGSAATESTYRLGNHASKFWCDYAPVTDVRLVVSSGKLICASDLAYGCNGY